MSDTMQEYEGLMTKVRDLSDRKIRLEERLKTEGDLRKKIVSNVKAQAETEDLKVSFGVFPTNYEQDYCYILNYTSIIQ